MEKCTVYSLQTENPNHATTEPLLFTLCSVPLRTRDHHMCLHFSGTIIPKLERSTWCASPTDVLSIWRPAWPVTLKKPIGNTCVVRCFGSFEPDTKESCPMSTHWFQPSYYPCPALYQHFTPLLAPDVVTVRFDKSLRTNLKNTEVTVVLHEQGPNTYQTCSVRESSEAKG